MVGAPEGRPLHGAAGAGARRGSIVPRPDRQHLLIGSAPARQKPPFRLPATGPLPLPLPLPLRNP